MSKLGSKEVPRGSKDIAPEDGMERSGSKERRGSMQEARSQIVTTKIVRAPRPEVPWVPQKYYGNDGKEMVGRSGSKKGSKGWLGGRKGSKRRSKERRASKEMNAFGEPQDMEEFSDEEYDDAMIQNNSSCFTKRVLPATLFVLGALMWIRFWMYYVETSQRNNGQCFINDYMKGKDCRDCFFEISVNGLEKFAEDQVTFQRNDDGEVVAESRAYQCCGVGENSQAPNCCKFQTVEDDMSPKFCDRVPVEEQCKFDDGNWFTSDPSARDSWPCNYLMGANGNPHDIKYGDTTFMEWMWLYLSLLFLGLLFPLSLVYNQSMNKKFLRELEETVESSRAYQEQKEKEQEMGRKDALDAKLKAAQRGRDHV